MLQKVTSKNVSRTVPITAKPPRADAPSLGSNPAPVVVAGKPSHPVYGDAVIGESGLALTDHPIWMLNYWHKRASDLLEPWNAPGKMSEADDKKYQAIHANQWDIFRAAGEVELGSAKCVAEFLEMTERHHQYNGGNDDNIVISGKWLRKITVELKAVTAFPRPTKKIGALAKGGKLTRAGLMLRYHAFLIGELSTLGIAFYGCRDYPERMIPMDSAVHARVSNNFKDGKPINDRHRRTVYPFFDESRLTDRAKSVLKSLKIDVTKAERR